MKRRGFICNSQLAVPCTPFQRCCPQPAHTTGTCALLGALPWGRAGPSHVGPRLLAATAPNQVLGDRCAAPHHGLPITSTSSPPFSHSESASTSTGLVPVAPWVCCACPQGCHPDLKPAGPSKLSLSTLRIASAFPLQSNPSSKPSLARGWQQLQPC